MSNANPFATGPGPWANGGPPPEPPSTQEGTWGAPPDTYTHTGNPFAVAAAEAPPQAAPNQQPFAYPQNWAPKSKVFIPWTEIVVLGLMPILFLIMINVAAQGTGPSQTVKSSLLALIPLTVVLLTVLWIDRLEPEPRTAKIFAFLWGGAVSVFVALQINNAFALAHAKAHGVVKAEIFTATVVAPISEEIIKGAGLLLIFFLRPRWIDGPVDGVVYGMLIGGGFAFTENIMYFTNAAVTEAAMPHAAGLVGEVFFLRGVLSPFMHALMTLLCGLAVGLVARGKDRPKVLWAFPVGLLAAIGFHMLWNRSAFSGDFFGPYATVHVPMLLMSLGLVLWLRGREAAILRQRLAEFGQAGWFDANEVQMVSSVRLRRGAVNWARQIGGPPGAAAMRSFQRTATELGYVRNRLIHGRAGAEDAAKQETLLGQIQTARQQLYAATTARRN